MATFLYDVTVQVFAAGGDTIRVEAEDEDKAAKKAEEIAKSRFYQDGIKCDLQEVVTNCVEEVPLPEKPGADAEHLIQCTTVHAEQSDNPDHEVGDLQSLVRIAWDIMSDEQRARFVHEASDRDLCWQ